MYSKTTLLVLSAAIGAAVVRSQAAPNWIYIPKSCTDQCTQTLESAYLCQNQFAGNTNQIYGCFCNDFPSDAATCASCLNSNDAAALGSLLSSTITACPQAVKSCFFSCSFDTCGATDVACQCDANYLQNIYNCGSCNTANGNTGVTLLSDFQSLQQSCKAQNFAGADQNFQTSPLPSPTTDGYQAPELTASGGGAAATGDFSATDGVLAAGADGASATPASNAAATGNVNANANAAGAGGAGASGKSVTQTVVTAAQTSGAALPNALPAMGGVFAMVGAIVAAL